MKGRKREDSVNSGHLSRDSALSILLLKISVEIWHEGGGQKSEAR